VALPALFTQAHSRQRQTCLPWPKLLKASPLKWRYEGWVSIVLPGVNKPKWTEF
jgi:hypothetical protein